MDERLITMCAGVLCSALYLSGVFVAGLVTKNALAWQCALASMGFCYMSYLGQYHATSMTGAKIVLLLITVISIALGAVGGFCLLKW